MSLLKDSDGVRRKNWSKLKNLKLTFHDSWCIYIPGIRRQRKLKNMCFSPSPPIYFMFHFVICVFQVQIFEENRK